MALVIFFALVAASAADNRLQDGGGLKLEHISDSSIIRELVQRMDSFEAREKRYVESIAGLKQEVTSLKDKIETLQHENKKQAQLISTLVYQQWQQEGSRPASSDKTKVDVPFNASKVTPVRQDVNIKTSKIWRQMEEKQRRLNPVVRQTDDVYIQRNIQRRENEVNVAFTAGLTHRMLHLGAHQNIIFDHVETNIGNGYNSHHGVFTAPVAGIYVIFVSVLADNNREIWCQIVVNGNNKADVYARGTDGRHDQGSNAVIIQLQQGDDVAVQNVAADDSVYGDPGIYTTFSGFLLLEGFLQSGSIVG